MNLRMRYSLSQTIRNGWDTLFKSRAERYLEAENSRLIIENQTLKEKLNKLERAVFPLTGQAGSAYIYGDRKVEKHQPIPGGGLYSRMMELHMQSEFKENENDNGIRQEATASGAGRQSSDEG